MTGRKGLEKRAAASRGEVLGAGWGSKTGDFAELFFRTPKTLKPARVRFRYARQVPGDAWLDLILDSVPVGRIRLASTGADGEKAADYRDVSLDIGQLKAGYHRLYVTVVADGRISEPLPETKPTPDPILDQIGGRDDKTSVGHGRNVALYAGRGAGKRFFFATHELGNVFNATDGETLLWNPDHVLLEGNSIRPEHASEVFIDTVMFEAKKGPLAQPTKTAASQVIEQRQVCVSKDDIVVSRIWVSNQTDAPVRHTIQLMGDCRKSFDWREQPNGQRETQRRGDHVVLVDHSVFPNALKRGLHMAIGADVKPTEIDTQTPGAYRMQIDVDLQPRETVAASGGQSSAAASRFLRAIQPGNGKRVEPLS